MNQIKSYLKGQKTRLTPNFYSTEFDCKCKDPDCQLTLIDLFHVIKLQALRDQINKSISISSAYRCEKHNKSVGGAPNSQHLIGTATDLTIKNLSPNETANLCEPLFNGVGRYDTFTHVDSRGTKAKWDLRNKK